MGRIATQKRVKDPKSHQANLDRKKKRSRADRHPGILIMTQPVSVLSNSGWLHAIRFLSSLPDAPADVRRGLRWYY